MTVQVKFFGNLVELIGTDTMQLQNVFDTDTLRKKLIIDFPQLGNHSFAVAVENKIVRENQILHAGNVVAFLPPFAGG